MQNRKGRTKQAGWEDGTVWTGFDSQKRTARTSPVLEFLPR
jgi:hypothetical protein